MVGDLVDTIMRRGDRVPISLFIATHSVFTQMWEVLATLRLRGRPARDGCQVHCETVLGDAFSTSPQICSPKQSHNALWQLSRPGLPRNFKWRIDHFRLLKSLTFKIRPSAQPFLWKWVLFTWEWKLISISKAEHLTSFWYRGLGELENGLLPAKKSVELPENLTIACGFCFLYSFSLSVFACESCSQQSLQTGIQVSACVRVLSLMYIQIRFCWADVYFLHKTRNKEVSPRSRAVTIVKCPKSGMHVQSCCFVYQTYSLLLLLLLFWRSRCRCCRGCIGALF